MEIAGHNINNWWLVGGAGAVVAGIYWYRKQSAAATANAASASSTGSSSSSSAIDPVTGLPYSEDDQTDPITGMTYLAEAEEYGSVQAADEEVTSGSAYYGDTGADEAEDVGYPTIYPETESTAEPGAYENNAQWAQAVTTGLAALGYNEETVSGALGAFLAQLPLSTSQASIVQAAEAEYGPPPVGNYSIIPQPSTSTPTPSGSTVTVPNVVGMRQQDAVTAIQNAGLKSHTGSGFISDEINIVGSQTPGAGTKVASGSTVDIGGFTHSSK
jgi:hypothetical protein